MSHQKLNTDEYHGLLITLDGRAFRVHEETGLQINAHRLDDNLGWHVNIEWTRPQSGIGIKWKLNTHSPVPVVHYQAFESLGGKFDNNKCSFVVPAIADFVFE